ncbi:MAG: hypothetical protein KUL83_00700 [Lentimicrobium sp.]|nr:hypothetical protein [Lentimicrobium sp.]MDD2527571.1 glycosyltransferase [Lentimicrobiaceae bacterium]MDD4597117.1 glycosyltransferase [Lentimicrobiaceae bacterium]MDY0025118.1 glycosyltransferase [Lentimicrobium sp.]HAH59951.1 glycosyl transferase family 28 [Bacteroidales bacterium]
MNSAPLILVSPLDWGLGHATRCIPVIHLLLQQGARVIIAAEGETATILHESFPQLTIIPFKGYNIRYHRRIPAGFKLIFSAWRIVLAIIREQQAIRRVVQEYKIDAIISDNRYGLWHPKIYSVFITHQLNIISPVFPQLINPLLAALVRFFVNKFDVCWIPDYGSEDNLSGKLSHGRPLPENALFIGPLSRFRTLPFPTEPVQKFDLVAIVSGPEPQRGIFRQLLIDQLPLKEIKSLIVSGVPGNNQMVHLADGLYEIGHLPAEALFNLLATKPLVVCRAGYSTLMDIEVTGNPALLIPTPGQTEQEYLARKLHAYEGYIYQPQNKFSLVKAHVALKGQLPKIPRYDAPVNDAYIRELMVMLEDKNSRNNPLEAKML